MRRTLFRFACYSAATMMLAFAATQPSVAQTTPVLTVDAAGNPHPINPDVYGIANYNLDAGFAKEIQVPNIRWGGDGTTRYNWQVDSSNSGFDWYFMGGNGEATATPSASADLMINTYKTASNASTLLTIPIIPYVNKSAAWSCSFPVSGYGAQQSTHQRIPDYFDEHNYGGGSIDAAELASTRALWDPTFNSGSWVEQFYFDGPMMLLPRFQNWIQTYYPGTKLAISEYSFSSGTNPLVDALTEADVLGIYGRQSLDFANLWTVPKPTDPVAYSFRLYRNYDGAGGQFGNTSVDSSSTDPGQLSEYGALRSSDGALTVVAINKTTSAIQTSLTVANFSSSATAAVYTYSNANLAQIVVGTPVAVVSGALNYNFPAYSATVFVFTPEASAPVATTTSLTASSTHATSGQAITFTATVAPKSGSGVPAGTVAFSDGSTQIGTASVNSSGSAVLDTSSLAIGSHSISAAYSGDTNFASSESAAVSVTISAPAKIATTTSVSASATQLTAGQNVTFTAGVAPQTGTGVPTGSITFLDGQAQLGIVTLNGGAASFSTANLAAGTHTITAAYSGDSNYAASTSSAFTVAVAAAASADYSLTMSSSSLSVAQGSSGSLMLTVTPKNGFKHAVSFSCSGLPGGGGCTFNPQTVDPVASAVSTTLNVQLPAAAEIP